MDVSSPVLDRDGYLKVLSAWSEDLARDSRDRANVNLTGDHWRVIAMVRDSMPRPAWHPPCAPGETRAYAARRRIRFEYRADAVVSRQSSQAHRQDRRPAPAYELRRLTVRAIGLHRTPRAGRQRGQ